MRFERLDLNLLVALDVLLAEQSVSLAAERLNLSQSAMSSALGRLRQYFGDELLVLQHRHMVLTRRAEGLIGPVKAVLERIRTTIAVAPAFDPATSDRRIRIMASDYTMEVLLTGALKLLARAAPAMRFEIKTMNDAPADALERNAIDLLIALDYVTSPDHPAALLFEDDYVLMGAADNPALAGNPSFQDYMTLGHVTARFGNGREPSFEDWLLRQRKAQRNVEVVAPSFTALPGLVLDTHRVATMHRRLAARFADDPRFVLRELPFATPPIREMAQWHIADNSDAALRWFVRGLQAQASGQVLPHVVAPPPGDEP